jgi:hypothetical protein
LKASGVKKPEKKMRSLIPKESLEAQVGLVWLETTGLGWEVVFIDDLVPDG